MEITKKILNISIAVSLVVSSFALLIFSVRDSKAIAAPRIPKDEFTAIGVAYGDYMNQNSRRVAGFVVWGYNPTTNVMKPLSMVSCDAKQVPLPE